MTSTTAAAPSTFGSALRRLY
ncbi:MAG: hypothetical protein JWN36_1356, partial [Microbacteriaceae bacterium]|nr:hypothetical protein [Microbacteriaceae bacterium]